MINMGLNCDKCGKRMELKKERLFGQEVDIKLCKCGNRLMNIDQAIKLQQKLLPKIHEERKIIEIGDSIAITFPKDIKKFFSKGEKVMLDFDPKNMELKITKEYYSTTQNFLD